jgi:hypothetical protein
MNGSGPEGAVGGTLQVALGGIAAALMTAGAGTMLITRRRRIP